MKKGREEPGKDKSHAFAAISLDNQAQQLNKQSSSSSQSTSQDIDPYLVRFLIVPHSLSNYISRPFIAYLPCRNVFDRTIIWLHQQIHTFLKEDKLDNKNESNFTPNSSSQSEQLSLSLFSWFIALWLRVHKNGFSQGYLSIRLTDEMINQYKQYSDKEDLDMGLGGDEEDEEDIDGIIGQNDDAQDFDFDSLEEKKENADFPGIPLNKL
ncbi:MAG: hypothetical protein EZS28_016787 [Streblomastix strix]|uniref:Uncharacterized protein n=1 Tax=Streblomastix strix TaxID=222440 RepID=A0A5J4VYL4_9EUKA|nr:MAG: hypothetical protein EZS28_016787 [Streblomastix strix]